MSSSAIVTRWESRAVLREAFVWMTLGLALSAAVAWVVSQTASLTDLVAANPAASLVGIGVWAVLGLGFGAFVRHVPAAIGAILYVLYTGFTGLALSWIFAAYTDATILYALVSTVALFAVITVFALATSIDLTRWWTYIIFGILGMGVAYALNAVLFRSESLDLLLSLTGVALFSFSTAATVQKIVKMEHELAPELHGRASIIGAMMLYTNFINLFLRLLALYSRSQRRR